MSKTSQRLGLIVFGCLVIPAYAPAAAEDQLPCRPNLVHCNYAEHFSGTVHWRSVLESTNPPSKSIDELTVTVTNGKADCAGTIDGRPVKGAGLLAVERGTSMEDEPGQPWYEISVSCPGADGRTPNIDNAQIKTYKQKDTTGFKTLADKIAEDNADADPDNGVTGTTVIDWSISRSGDARP